MGSIDWCCGCRKRALRVTLLLLEILLQQPQQNCRSGAVGSIDWCVPSDTVASDHVPAMQTHWTDVVAERVWARIDGSAATFNEFQAAMVVAEVSAAAPALVGSIDQLECSLRHSGQRCRLKRGAVVAEDPLFGTRRRRAAGGGRVVGAAAELPPFGTYRNRRSRGRPLPPFGTRRRLHISSVVRVTCTITRNLFF